LAITISLDGIFFVLVYVIYYPITGGLLTALF